MAEIHPNIVSTPPWLAIVGIGEDGVDGLTDRACDLIRSAESVFGGARHLSLVAPLIRGTTQVWSNPLDRSIAQIVAERGRRVCILASGDPFQHGIGSVLVRHIPTDEIVAVPALSAFSLAASRLLWPLQQTTLLSLCGHPLDLIRPHLQPGARILALTSDSNTPVTIAKLLCEAGFGPSRVTVLEALGGPRERIRSAHAAVFNFSDLAALNTVAVEVVPESSARILPLAPGLADPLFEHDGQITKREIRALTLSALAPKRREHLWDVGAGSGSVGIEWMLADPSLTAVAIERRTDRVARIRRNAAAFGVPNLQVVEGDAREALNALQPPDAVFVGGGATTPGIVEAAQRALRLNGRLVINAVTLETEALVLRKYAQEGGSLVRIDIQRAQPMKSSEGKLTAWHPARPITQWTWIKQ